MTRSFHAIVALIVLLINLSRYCIDALPDQCRLIRNDAAKRPIKIDQYDGGWHSSDLSVILL